MTHEEIVKILRRDNASAPLGDLHMYAEAWAIHRAASANVRENGPLCAHPRTGAPMENPYLAIAASQLRVMQALKRVSKTDRLWSAA